ncbi:hypothetical protein I302_100915 [Kwoniella bestiolae CBS 10118]|uniref:Uncharacterized protein n=1 Tax=Kwoniella bestiolae CBS 10118 TaxID=1296100 RepID=A0A1B9G6E6_9TREE|nr:hypothetical protein I302_04291 [Kwoniella bestiolae CBS 10118]OCF26605.1 hypothetical protein I302_04291 [Kwoniella bestiolae CBS 10118]
MRADLDLDHSTYGPSTASLVLYSISPSGTESITLAAPKRADHVDLTSELAKVVDLTLANVIGKPSKRFSVGSSCNANKMLDDAQSDIDGHLAELAANHSRRYLRSDTEDPGSLAVARTPSEYCHTLMEIRDKFANPHVKGLMVVYSNRPSDLSESLRKGGSMATHGILNPTLFGDEKEQARKALSAFASHISDQAKTLDVSKVSFDDYSESYNNGQYRYIVMTPEEERVFEGIEVALDLPHVSPDEVYKHERHKTDSIRGSGGKPDFDGIFAQYGK